jgi:heme exporter protein D
VTATEHGVCADPVYVWLAVHVTTVDDEALVIANVAEPDEAE